MFVRILLALSISSLANTYALSAAAPELTADDQQYDADAQVLTASGNALFIHDELTVKANEVRFFRTENSAAAKGDVAFTSGTLRMIGEEAYYDVDDRSFSATNVRVGALPILARGDKIEGTVDAIVFHNADIYLNEPGPLSVSLQAEKAILYPGDRLVTENVRLRIGEGKLITLPKYTYHLKESLIRFRARAGYRSNLGAYLQTTSLVPLNDRLKIGAVADVYTERGIFVGPAFEWKSSGSDYKVESSLYSGYINDTGDRGEDILLNPIEEDRYFIEFRHKQQYDDDRLSLTAAISAWSDSFVTRDFRDDLYRDNQQPDSFIEGVMREDNFFVSAFARIDPNDFQVVQQRLPEIRMDYLSTEIKDTGIYQNFFASAARLKEDDPTNVAPDLESDRLDAYYGLRYPMTLGDGFSFVPMAGLRTTFYDDTVGSSDSYTRVMGQVGFDLEKDYFAQWDYKNNIWGIDGLRHIVRPVVRYRYFPGGKYGNSSIIPIDRDVDPTVIPSIDLEDIRDIDDLTNLNMFRIGLENVLQTRDTQYGSRDLLSLNLYQDIILEGNDNSQEWDMFYVQLKVNPAHWLDFDLYSRIDPEDLTLEQIGTSLRIKDGDIRKIRFRTEMLQHQIDQYILDYEQKLSETWGVRAEFRYDSRLNELTEQVYSLRQRVGKSWRVEYQVAILTGSSREDSANFRVRFDFLQF